jgi:outer membrane lipoprotein carrier protein
MRCAPRLRNPLTALLFACACQALAGDTGTALDRYLNGLTTLRTGFTQTVSDTQGKQIEQGEGTLLVQRPGKFRWDYTPHRASQSAGPNAREGGGDGGAAAAGGQLLVADGRNLWFYDRELAQATVKPESSALSATPMLLLSGSADQLRQMFEIEAGGTRDGMDWVRVRPRSADGDFGAAELGFSRDQLSRMTITDRLGQTVQMDFTHSERNVRLSAEDLQFQPPAGVDVIGTAQ